jgi:hypothetical protein
MGKSVDLIIGDVVWPALYLSQLLLTWYVIVAGLALEYWFIKKVTTLNWWEAIIADCAVNAVSTLFGIILIPISGLLWEVSAGGVINWLFDTGTFNIGSWIATVLLAAVVNAGIETAVLVFGFKQKWQRRLGLWMLFANALSVGLAFAGLLVPQSAHS